MIREPHASYLGADPSAGQGMPVRAPRTNLFVAATIEADNISVPVRIRNISETGAMIEGAAFPAIGTHFTLRRMEMEIGARVVWLTGKRAGVHFDGRVAVAEWVSGKATGSMPAFGQLRVDAIQAAIRTGTAIPAAFASPPPSPTLDGTAIDHRVAEELAYVARMLEDVAAALVNEPILLQRHGKALQSFDISCQILEQLARLMASDDKPASVRGIAMEDLRNRLSRPMRGI